MHMRKPQSENLLPLSTPSRSGNKFESIVDYGNFSSSGGGGGFGMNLLSGYVERASQGTVCWAFHFIQSLSQEWVFGCDAGGGLHI